MDLSKLSVSNGSGEAVRALVTVLRAPGGTVITPNSLVNWPTNFVATTGPLLADGTLDPTKTIVFLGHISGSTIVIDQLAPGYVDTYGSAVGDVVVIKPNTWWADTLVNAASTNKAAIDTINNTTFPLRQSEGSFNYIASGGVITGDSYGSTRNASMTAIVAYINGIRQTVAAVTARTYTASKDTYVDLLYSTTGAGTLVYTEVANNAASPALAANSIRLGIVVTGASNIAGVGSINQGEEYKVLPIASSIPYAVTDSLGNLIAPRDPARKVLGYRQITTAFGTTSTTQVQVTGLSCPVIVPTGRKVRVSFLSPGIYNGTTNTVSTYIGIWEGTVGSGTMLANPEWRAISPAAQVSATLYASALRTPAASSQTYNIGLNQSGASSGVTVNAAPAGPAAILVELA